MLSVLQYLHRLYQVARSQVRITHGGDDRLPLSQGLIDLRSEQGEELLRDGDALEAYVPLSASFVTQETQAFCGVASMVTVLNALGVPAPMSPKYAP